MAIHEHLFADERPFANCHASTLAWLGHDRFLAAWFGGTKEKHPDVGIWGASRSDGLWSPPRLLIKLREQAHWNPVLLCAPDGAVHLWFKVGLNPTVWSTWTMVSEDAGASWSEPRELVPGDVGGRGPVKNRPLVLSDGAWLAPASIEAPAGDGRRWDVFADRSEDGGLTWQRFDVPIDREANPSAGAIQPSFWESSPGQVHLLCRTSFGYLGRSDSTDGGRTWSTLRDAGLPNNNSGIDLAHLPDGRLVLAHNPVAANWGARWPLRLAVSADGGETWPRSLDIETVEGEFSYPSVIPVGEDRVACSYTWRRERIAGWFGRVSEIDG